jgi:DNA-binding MarR family transcriptional regulator
MANRSDRDVSRAAQGETDASSPLTKQEFVQLANFRYMVRVLARHTELAARGSGITPQQYQLLLAIKGLPDRDWANITEIAERLQVRHNAVIGLVNRAEAQHLVRREYDAYPEDRRVVCVSVTSRGEAIISAMANALRKEREQVISAARAFGQSPSSQPRIDDRYPAQL